MLLDPSTKQLYRHAQGFIKFFPADLVVSSQYISQCISSMLPYKSAQAHGSHCSHHGTSQLPCSFKAIGIQFTDSTSEQQKAMTNCVFRSASSDPHSPQKDFWMELPSPCPCLLCNLGSLSLAPCWNNQVSLVLVVSGLPGRDKNQISPSSAGAMMISPSPRPAPISPRRPRGRSVGRRARRGRPWRAWT